jgi:glycosyltransferase involved in cell wall biosynthesis
MDPSASLRILYFYRVPLPDARADAIQIVNTCAGIARAGGEVRLHVETLGGGDAAACWRFYGLEPPPAEGAGGVALVPLGRHWSWPVLPFKVRGVLRKARRSRTCLFVREVRPYVPPLMARARRAGLTVLFEAHNVSSALAAEKRDRNPRGAWRERTLDRHALEAAVLRGADGLVCTQRATLERLEALGFLIAPGLPTIVLGNGTQLPPRPAADRSDSREIDVLYCGSLKSWKGVDGLVRAMAELPGRRLTIVGPESPPDAARLQEAARAAGVLDRVRLRPAVPPSEVWSLYASARVGVIPLPAQSSIEAREFTSPLKLFEMMAGGLPIVASRLPSILEYVEDGREAVLVPPDDPAALARGIRAVLEDEPLARRLVEAARRLAEEHSWNARGRRLFEFARSIQPRKLG